MFHRKITPNKIASPSRRRSLQRLPHPEGPMSKKAAAVVAFPTPPPDRTKLVVIRALRQLLAALKTETLLCHVPRLEHLYESREGMPYHFKPEIFIQLSGSTEFSFPHQKISVGPGGVCLVPRGMPHGELARHGTEEFENVVISFYNGTVYLHVAHERTPGRPAVDNVQFLTTELFDDLIAYLDRISDLYHRDAAGHAVAIRALLEAEFSLLLGIIEMPNLQLPPASDTVALCKWLIFQRLHDEHLSLDALAAGLGVSSGYLSRLFHQKVGERIVEHINRLRIQNAIDALQHTRLSVKVIAAGCGYRDAGYFGRVFRQATTRTPQEYRRYVHRLRSSLEMQPKTVYARKNDYGAVPDLGELNAIDALRLTKLSVKAIAAGCGYRDAKLFSRFFRQATGTTPQNYRREIQRLMSADEPKPEPDAAARAHGLASAFASFQTAPAAC